MHTLGLAVTLSKPPRRTAPEERPAWNSPASSTPGTGPWDVSFFHVELIESYEYIFKNDPGH